MTDTTEQLWAGRALRFINSHARGINTWRHGDKVPVTTLTFNAHLRIADTVNDDGELVERQVEFWMKDEHMATFTYRPQGRKNQLKLSGTAYH